MAFVTKFPSSRFQKSVVNGIFLIPFLILSALCASRSRSLSIYKRTKGFCRLAALPTHLGNTASGDATGALDPSAIAPLATVQEKAILYTLLITDKCPGLLGREERHCMTPSLAARLSLAITVTTNQVLDEPFSKCQQKGLVATRALILFSRW